MSLLTKKRLVIAKIESVYGTDSVPTGANAILLKNLDVQPIQAELVSRDLIRPYLGVSERLLASKAVQLSFEVEYAGAGVVGNAPAYGALLQACAMAKTVTQVSCTAAISTEVVTVTKVAHGYLTGDKLLMSGFTDSAANGEFTITKTGADTFTYPAPAAVDDMTADGTPKINTAVVYNPVSTSFDSVTIYFNVDGVLHKATGCRGTFEIDLAVKQIPVFKFTMTGLYNAPTDTSAVTPDFSDFQIPYLANTQNTPGFSLFGYSALLESASLNMTNSVELITLIGAESVKVLDRAPAGQLVFEAPTITAKDFFSLVSANTTGAMTLSHGALNGHKVNLSCPSVNLGNPVYQDSNGVQMLSVPFTASPSSTGNDEVTITIQ